MRRLFSIALLCLLLPLTSQAIIIVKTGYCFDVAVSQDGEYLYVPCGFGTHILKIEGDELIYCDMLDAREYYHRNIKIEDDVAYIVDSEKGLEIFDISNPSKPVRKYTNTQGSEISSRGMGLFVKDGVVFQAADGDGLCVIDSKKPPESKRMSLIQLQDKPWDLWDVWIEGNYAFAADINLGVNVVDVSDLTKPKFIANVSWADNDNMAEIVRGNGDSIFIGAGKHGLIAIDVSNPKKPVVKDTLKSHPASYGEGLCVDGDMVYYANGNKEDTSENGLFVIDASDLSNLKVLGTCVLNGWVEGVCKFGDRVFVATTRTGVSMIDVSNPKQPKEVFHWTGEYDPTRQQ